MAPCQNGAAFRLAAVQPASTGIADDRGKPVRAAQAGSVAAAARQWLRLQKQPMSAPGVRRP